MGGGKGGDKMLGETVFLIGISCFSLGSGEAHLWQSSLSLQSQTTTGFKLFEFAGIGPR